MNNANKILDEAIGLMAERIMKKCQPFYRGRLEIESPNSDNESEVYIYFEEAGYLGRRLKSVMAEVAMVDGILRKKIFSIFRDRNAFGIRWVRIFDERINPIIEEEIEVLQIKLPDFEVEIGNYPQNFSD